MKTDHIHNEWFVYGMLATLVGADQQYFLHNDMEDDAVAATAPDGWDDGDLKPGCPYDEYCHGEDEMYEYLWKNRSRKTCLE